MKPGVKSSGEIDLIRLIRPFLNYDMIESEARQIIESGWLTRGAHCQKFREDLEIYTGAAHCALTTSATTALYSCLKILGIGPGDEVAVSDFSFPASSNVIEEVGARPVFIDVCAENFNMDVNELQRNWNSRIKAVIFVDAFGNLTNLSQVVEFCRSKDIPLIEDAACAIGARIGNRACGSIADLTCFSFHPRKLLTTGEGGAITAKSDQYAIEIDQYLSHGSRKLDDKFEFSKSGQNFRMSELQALMGWKQLAMLDEVVEERLLIWNQLTNILGDLGFKAQSVGHGIRFSAQSLVFQVPETVDRDDLIHKLRLLDVEATLGTYCLSGTKFNRKKYNKLQPVSWRLQNSTITLPCYSGLPVDTVISAIKEALKELR